MTRPVALVSDFDGTISDDDFFNYIVRRYLNDDALKPWQEYLNGRKKHFDALAEMFAKLRIAKTEFDAFIDTIVIDKSFIELAEFCALRKVPVFICSAGSDYYIRRRLRGVTERLHITLISNPGVYDEKTGLVIRPNRDYYDSELGVSKAAVVQELCRQGFYVVYCGDGAPDIKAAAAAQKVFARSRLYELCRQYGIPAEKLENFNNVKNFMEEIIR